jgi:hypothetical protein
MSKEISLSALMIGGLVNVVSLSGLMTGGVVDVVSLSEWSTREEGERISLLKETEG